MLVKLASAAATATLGLFLTQTLPAAACGGLVAPNGAIRLSRATTLVAWHDGIEHYMTSFTYHGNATNFGWIVPLPAVPDKIEEGGAWTLQRLFRETHPLPRAFFFSDRLAAGAAAPAAEVLQQLKVEALDITVLRGSGQAVMEWAKQNGFALSDETRAHFLVYAKGSPIFMAAKYDAAAAKARGQLDGDGAPVLITMKLPHLWVPLEVLAVGNDTVNADLYLLTDRPANTSELGAVVGQSAVGTTVPGAPGFTLAFQAKLNPALFTDLSTDRNMGWVQPESWLTHMRLDAPGRAVTYDMGITPTGVIKLAPYGTAPMAVVDGIMASHPARSLPTLPLGAPQAALALIACLVAARVLWNWTTRSGW